MQRVLDNPANVSAPFGDRFAHVARVDLEGGALLMLSGQVAVDDSGEVVAPGDITVQSERSGSSRSSATSWPRTARRSPTSCTSVRS
ncbi:hypothetical protein [Actinopolymorpha pittospori]|uniref:Uncharacterized protein n=1 Tax=Actinopolymorpha pittospori TaxID=648752 RepID=A0A927RCS5_9ACTN|nr:hypothetical protein [Actinopolymorpha pittospori]MBE1611582.1 hypothetical protein [Actinopolymorpha pittospori]